MVILKTMVMMMNEHEFVYGVLIFTFIFFSLQLIVAYFGGYL